MPTRTQKAAAAIPSDPMCSRPSLTFFQDPMHLPQGTSCAFLSVHSRWLRRLRVPRDGPRPVRPRWPSVPLPRPGFYVPKSEFFAGGDRARPVCHALHCRRRRRCLRWRCRAPRCASGGLTPSCIPADQRSNNEQRPHQHRQGRGTNQRFHIFLMDRGDSKPHAAYAVAGCFAPMRLSAARGCRGRARFALRSPALNVVAG